MDPPTHLLRTSLLEALLTIPFSIRSPVFDLIYDRTRDSQTFLQFQQVIADLHRGHRKVLLFALYTYWGRLSNDQLSIPSLYNGITTLEKIIRKNAPLLNFELDIDNFRYIENYY